MQYPNTFKVDQIDLYHGVEIADPYRWLEDDHSPETAEWVRTQNELTFEYLHGLPHREPFRARLTELWNYTRYSAPARHGEEYFFFRNDGLQNQGVLYAQATLTAEPRMVFDPNTLSPDGTISLSTISFTSDGSLLGYGISRSGSDWAEFHVRRLATGEDLEDDIRWVKFSSLVWTHDNAGFFYARFPEPEESAAYSGANLNHRLYYHRLGTPQAEDVLVCEFPEHPGWRLYADISEDGRHLYIYVGEAGVNNLIYHVDLLDPMGPSLDAPLRTVIGRFDAYYHVIGQDRDVLYVQTDRDAPHGRLIAIDMNAPEPENWRVIIPEREDVIQSVSLVSGRFVVVYLHNAASKIRLYDMHGVHTGDIPLPAYGTVISSEARRRDTEIFYMFTSFLYPTSVFRYDMITGENSLIRTPDMKFDRDTYETRQVWYSSKDGTQVPIFLTHKKGIALDGSNPTLLYGYGGFNNSLTPFFSSAALLWLEQGGIYAIPNLRGGGEFGEEWHRAGTLERKQNVFDDFIAAAEYLIRNGYTSPGKLALQGGSNGGLLVGAVMCQRPDLFAVALPAVGVMDMLRYHKFTIGMAWRADYGISDDRDGFESLFAYSPLHNLRPGVRYPATLITTADHDDRVVPAHSFKFAARLQECQEGPAPVLIRIDTKAGHGGGKPTAMVIEEYADVLAFAYDNMM
ncbi:MAG: prolyl oligopeptidase family serine peptidase [Bacteroidota bacterium]